MGCPALFATFFGDGVPGNMYIDLIFIRKHLFFLLVLLLFLLLLLLLLLKSRELSLANAALVSISIDIFPTRGICMSKAEGIF